MTVVVKRPREDSIDRAGWLIRQGYVQGPESSEVQYCWSQVYGKDKMYEVTLHSCTCYVGEYRKAIICKHRWGCFGALAVCLILEIRQAISQCDLESIGASYSEGLKKTDEIFVSIARAEYRKRQKELEELAHRAKTRVA